jgi:hypothetical protein
MAPIYILLCEGPDDVAVLYHLLNYHQIPLAPVGQRVDGQIALEHGSGIRGVLRRLRVELKPQDEDVGIAYLGIMVDADEQIESRWQALRDIFRGAGYNAVPDAPDPAGTIIIEQGRIGLGIWLMPNNQLAGALEHFAQMLLPDNDRLWDRARSAVDQIPVEERLFPEGDTFKAQLHTWLAWQREPGRPIGQALNNRYLNADAPHAYQLVAWIRRLFPDLQA